MEIAYALIIYPQLKEWWWKVEEEEGEKIYFHGDIKAFSKPLIIFITFHSQLPRLRYEVYLFMDAILWSHPQIDPNKFSNDFGLKFSINLREMW